MGLGIPALAAGRLQTVAVGVLAVVLAAVSPEGVFGALFDWLCLVFVLEVYVDEAAKFGILLVVVAEVVAGLPPFLVVANVAALVGVLGKNVIFGV